MKDASGATDMDPKTQVTSLHGISMLDAARRAVGSRTCASPCCASARRERQRAGQRRDRRPRQPARRSELAAAQAAREAGNAPNAVLAAAASILGPRRVEACAAGHRDAARPVPAAGSSDAADEELRPRPSDRGRSRRCSAPTPDAQGRGPARGARGARRQVGVRALPAQPRRAITADAVLAAMALTLAWGPLQRKRISRLTAENLPWWLSSSAR